MDKLKVSLVVPIYNEANNLPRFLEQIDALKLPIEKELIFIDDCSKDNSLQILEGFPFKSPYQILKQDVNQGKGAALHRGIQVATGHIIGIQDADFEYDIDDIPALLVPLMKDKADVVFGSRFKQGGQVHRTFHYLVNRVLTLMSNMVSGLYLTDMETCYKFFRADIIQNMKLESKRFGFEPEVTAKIAKLKVRVHEISINYFPRTWMEGKKITWKDGIAAIVHIFRFNFCVNREDSFTKQLPERFIPRDSNLL